MKKYTSPKLSVELFETEDVITASVFSFINDTQAADGGSINTVDLDEVFS